MRLIVKDYSGLFCRKKVYTGIIEWRYEGQYKVLLLKNKTTVRIPISNRVFFHCPQMYDNTKKEFQENVEKSKVPPFVIKSRHIKGMCVMIAPAGDNMQLYVMANNSFIESFVHFEETYKKFNSVHNKMKSEVGQNIPVDEGGLEV